MLIKNTNLRRIVSLLFVLCLLFCLMPAAAFAEEYITEEVEDNPDNLKSLVSGLISINQEALYSNGVNGQIVSNHGNVYKNYGTIGTNGVYYYFGDLSAYAGSVSYNYGTVENNNTFVNYNYRTVENNSGTVDINYDTVVNNSNGTVDINYGGTVYGGTVTYNFGGTVDNNTNVVYNCFYLGIDYDLYEKYENNNTNSEESGLVFTDYRGPYCMLWGVQGKPLTLELDIKPGYEPYIKAGNGEIVKNDDGTYTISASLPGITVDVRPISTGSVPATADMSNVPLWSAMLLVFAATAILTRKKKNG